MIEPFFSLRHHNVCNAGIAIAWERGFQRILTMGNDGTDLDSRTGIQER